MRTLLVHQSFPGQYRHVAAALAARTGHQVAALGEQRLGSVPGVEQFYYTAPAGAGSSTHPYLRSLEAAVRRGQATARAAIALRARGFEPDLVCCHPGWGEGLYLRDVFPKARLLYYFEFFYAAEGADVGFDTDQLVSLDEAARVRTLNANHLLCLDAADWGQTPTEWQRSRFPAWAQDRITVAHEGVDTDLIKRDPTARFLLADGRSLSQTDEVVTFVARGLEPYRGFPCFMRALPEILRLRPRAQVVIVGGDQAQYGRHPANAASWRESLLKEVGARLDQARVHFVGRIPHPHLRALFSISSVHVYLTYPFVLSWSLIEAMASNCPVIGSDTAPVREVIRDGENGLLVPFGEPDRLAERTVRLLESPGLARDLAASARESAVKRFDLKRVSLPKHLALLDAVARGEPPVSDRGMPTNHAHAKHEQE
ncbi:glycosyltransferase [Roseomonas nepalensis]|uniref:Glycosyltransferase n=1 Tax=Muricoccus nepalensis TaxID=1854500 RepID=A0A502ETZ5_9PROT|nr:glycosyltransferase family 4 protein [Roseomonas nepalensis]TPG40269.1 glycosyltransferase [Roseomonas nepalensis]